MADLTITQKKDWAAMLYLKENLTQQEIAEKTGVSRQTIGKWIKGEKWEERKTALTLTREEQISNLYRQVAAINKNITDREEGKRFATPSEADSLNKLASAIKKMESDIGISDILSVGRRFILWVKHIDKDSYKNISRLFDAFIKSHL